MKKRNLTIALQLGILVAILIVVNLLSQKFFARIDLTEEKRFSVSEISETLIKNLDTPPLVTVYFAGEMPVRYKELESHIETFLSELRIQTDKNIEYEFVDPAGDSELFKEFFEKKYYPFQVTETISATEQKEMQLLPYISVTWRGGTEIFNIVRGCVYRTPQGGLEIDVVKAIQNFEYNLTTALYNMTRKRSKVIGFLHGHYEYNPGAIVEWLKAIEEYYTILPVSVKEGESISPSIDVLVVCKPDTAFSDREIYELDQYLMRGGKLLFLVDNQLVNFDIGAKQNTLTKLRELNLDYMFMKWGVKLNYDLLQDMYCDRVDVTTDNPTYGPRIESRPWVFHPMLLRFPDSPISRNLDRVSLRFASTLDTTHVQGIRYEVVLQSSEKARTVQGTQFIDVDQYLNKTIPPKLFEGGPYITGLVLRGQFNSIFRNREAPLDRFAPTKPTAVKLPVNVDIDVPKVAIISDAEFALGATFAGKIGPMPFDNKAFLMNMLDYLSGDGVLTNLRSKEVVIRMLDKEEIRGQETWIRIVNIGVPVLLLLIFGAVRAWFRRRKHLSYQVKEI